MRVLPRPLRSLTLVLCLLGALSPIARAQITFFDGFEGPEFHPRWTASPRSDWTYDFEGQRLNIRGQSVPGPVGITTPIGPFAGNFSVAAVIDFGIKSQRPRALRLRLDESDPGAFYPVAFIEYRESPGRSPTFFWSIPGLGGSTIVPPGPSTEFRLEIRRGGLAWMVLVNQTVVGFSTVGFLEPLQSVAMQSFSPPSFDPMSVDSIVVVPSPPAFLVGVLAAGCCSRRRYCYARLVGKSAVVRPV